MLLYYLWIPFQGWLSPAITTQGRTITFEEG
jgi:hypothetical protein